MSDEFDVVVVGAGPAGAAAALTARRAGASVLLLDRADFPGTRRAATASPRTRWTCSPSWGDRGGGGLRAAPALRMIAPGGGAVARALPDPRTQCPGRSSTRGWWRPPWPPVRSCAGTQCAGSSRATTGWCSTGRCPAGWWWARTAQARWCVARSATRRTPIGISRLPSGVRPALPGPTEQLIVTSKARWPAYAWSFPIGDGRANVGYGEVLRGESLSRAYLLDRLAALLPGTDLATVTALRAHHLPLSTHRPKPGRGRTLLAGDALSLINPFTGRASSTRCSPVRWPGCRGQAPEGAARRYAHRLRRRLGTHLRHSSVAAWLARRGRVVDAAVRAARRDDRVFHDVVELGLGDGRLTGRTLAMIGIGLRGGDGAPRQ
ncbi:FAD-dependent oxidoreductase [Micromonospora sp. M12]